jgi:hypothetical protein
MILGDFVIFSAILCSSWGSDCSPERGIRDTIPNQYDGYGDGGIFHGSLGEFMLDFPHYFFESW